MARTKPPYTPEFRSEAVRLARTSGRPPAEIARDLGCCTETLKSWINQVAIDEGKADGLTSEEREELKRLRRENRILREEREILKKAAVGSTDRCNTDYGLVSTGRWDDGADGQAGVDGRAEAGAMVAVAGW
jgi:transposase